MSAPTRLLHALAAVVVVSGLVRAQAPATPSRTKLPGTWRNVGAHPCVAPDGGTLQCPPASTRVIAVRAGRLFDSEAGTMLSKQVVLVQGERILDVGPESRVRPPAGAVVIDLSDATVLPGLIDAHTHMFNTPEKGTTRERATIIAVNNLQADLRAGFTAARDMSSHTNGYADVAMRDAINQGDLDGPRFQVAGRGIRWSATPANPSAPDDPLAGTAVRSAEDGRAAVRDHKAKGVDWIKLYPTGAYSFTPGGTAEYVLTYPLPVLQAIVDETHKLGLKAACHAFGGEGLQNAITTGCDTIEHGYGLTQAQLDQMVAKKLDFDPTLARYTAPYMDDNDAKSTGGKFRMIPIFENAVTMAMSKNAFFLVRYAQLFPGTAISPTRAAPSASSRFATLTQAMSSTRPVETRRIVSGSRTLSSILLCPRSPGARTIVRARNSCSAFSLKSVSVGASTSLMIVR